MTDQNNTPAGMKPFNLERALAGAPVVMRNGTKILEVLSPKSLSEKRQPVVCVNINESITTHCANGSYYHNSERPHDYDLFMLPETKTYWVNIYRANGIYVTGGLQDKLEDAENFKDRNWIKTISFEIDI